MELIEDRWLIAGRTYLEGKRLREWLAVNCGTVPAGCARVRDAARYGKSN